MRRREAITTIALSTLTGVSASVLLAAPGHATTAASLPGVVFTGWKQTPTTIADAVTVAGRDGSSPTALNVRTSAGSLPCATTGCSEFRFSPDGSRVTFLAGTGQTTSFQPTGALWIADMDGSNAHVLVNETYASGQWTLIAQTAWSADSSTVYFTSVSGYMASISQINADGSGFGAFPAQTTSSLVRNPDVLVDGRVVFTDGTTLKVYDPKTGATSVFFSQAADDQFAVSPDGRKIAISSALVAGLNGVPLVTLSIYNVDGTGTPVPVTLPGAGVANPVWSPDGGALGYVNTGTYSQATGTTSTLDHVEVHRIGDPAGTDTDLTAFMGQTAGGDIGWVPAPSQNPPTTLPSGGGSPGNPTVQRIGGVDRYGTGRLVSQAQWQAGTADAVVLARGDQSPDALAGVPLAAHVHGPLLLTDPTSLDPATRGEIDRVLGGPSSKKTVYILGGQSAVSPAIAGELSSNGYNVVRYGGATRYGTALQIATAFGPTSHVIVATGRSFPDALSAGPLGAAENAPIVLSDDNAVDPATAAFIEQHQSIDPVGGQAQRAVATLDILGKAVDQTLAGTDRYTTNSAVASRTVQLRGHTPATVGVASGLAFPDALTGGAYAANAGAPLLLTDPKTLSSPPAVLLSAWRTQLSAVEIFGGIAAVSGPTFNAAVTSVNGRVG